MNRTRRLALVLAPLLAPALSAQDDAAFLKAVFARYDADKDGVVVRSEYPGSDRQFLAIDADRNGKALFAEFEKSEIAKALVMARYANKDEPRARTTTTDLVRARFAALARFDANKDGKVTRAEWTGTELAFLDLDRDRNGVLDKRDRIEAEAEAPPEPPPLPEPKGPVPSVDDLMKRHDKDKSAVLRGKELGDKWLKDALAFADQNGDQGLDEQELRRLLAAIAERRAQGERSRQRPQPYQVPFDAWDKDKDGAVRQNEWMGSLSLFAQIDQDRDAAVSRDEVLRYQKRTLGRDFLERFDLDGDGRVTLAEFAGPPGAFLRADKNGDGSVTRADR